MKTVKTTILALLVGLINVYGIETTVTNGYYGKRIASGVYDAEDAAFFNTTAKLTPNITVGTEYVGADNDFIDLFASTSYKGVGTTFVATAYDEGDTEYEIDLFYDLPTFKIFDLSAMVALTDLDESIVYTPSITAQTSYCFGVFPISLGVEYGQSINAEEDYSFTRGFVSAGYKIQENISLVATVNYLVNDLDSHEDEASGLVALVLEF